LSVHEDFDAINALCGDLHGFQRQHQGYGEPLSRFHVRTRRYPELAFDLSKGTPICSLHDDSDAVLFLSFHR